MDFFTESAEDFGPLVNLVGVPLSPAALASVDNEGYGRTLKWWMEPSNSDGVRTPPSLPVHPMDLHQAMVRRRKMKRAI